MTKGSLKLRLSVPAPENVLLTVVVDPEKLVLFISSIAPAAMLAALVEMPFWVVLTLAINVPEFALVEPEYVLAPERVIVDDPVSFVRPPAPEMTPDSVWPLLDEYSNADPDAIAILPA